MDDCDVAAVNGVLYGKIIYAYSAGALAQKMIDPRVEHNCALIILTRTCACGAFLGSTLGKFL